MYSTTAFARLARVTVKTLRHYERVGLLVPKRTRASYRRYSIHDLQRLERILSLKSLGLSLATIRTLLKGDTLPLRSHREALEQKRARLDRAIDAINAIEQHSRPADALHSFFREAAWERWETVRNQHAPATPRPADRASESRVALIREIEAALAADPEGVRARELATRWRETVEPETLEAWKTRTSWPSGMRQYVASLYGTTPDTWDRIAAFIESTGHA